jgi:hypothetical protein
MRIQKTKMVNVSLDFAALLGLFDLILSLVFLIVSIVLPITRRRIIGELGILLYIFQAITAPVFLLLAGLIFLFQGWRLDPSLELAVFLLHILIFYLAVKDIVVFDRLLQYNRRSQ